MSGEEFIQWLNKTFKRTIDMQKLLRPDIGKLSLKESLTSILEELGERLQALQMVSNKIHPSIATTINSAFSEIARLLQEQSDRNDNDYATQKETALVSIKAHIGTLNLNWCHVVTAVLESKGFLKDEGIKKEYERALDTMRKESEKTLLQVKEESTKVINEAKKLADDIEQRARRTASKISVEEAQKQFEEAQKQCKKQVIIWAILSAVSIIAFVGLTVYLAFYYSLPKLSPDGGWHEIIYYTAIRIVFLGAIGSVASFCLSILRAYLHMMQHNLHRQRVANSMAAFIESAVTPEQRDMILAQLVDAIVSFGSSGLLPKKADAIYTPKMSIDTISRSFTPPTTK